jgi:ParB-like chromosome segregation protein Spo0J
MQLVADDRKRVLLSLTDLISLEKAGIPGGAFAMREINTAHVEDLVQSEPALWPPIQVTKSDKGYIVIDGYHRWEAARRRKLVTLLADCTTYTNTNDVVEATFRANLFHGLKASQETRSDYCFWLHVTYPFMRQEEIASRVGITQSAVSRAIARREAQLAEAERPTEEEQARRITRTCRRFTRLALRFLREIEGINYEALVQTLNTVAKKDAEREKIAKLADLLRDSAYPLRGSQQGDNH